MTKNKKSLKPARLGLKLNYSIKVLCIKVVADKFNIISKFRGLSM